MLGASVASVAVVNAPRDAAASTPVDTVDAPRVAARLVAPLASGSVLGPWRVLRVLPLDAGAVSVVLVDAEERSFQLDICARDPDPSAVHGPAHTEQFEIFLANEGDGSTSTHEDHGLAAMAVAEIVRANESQLSSGPFSTLRARLHARGARLHLA